MRWPFRALIPILPVFLLMLAGCERASEDTGREATAQEASSERDANVAEPCRLVMGWDPWQPYQFRDPHGEVTGLDVEIAVAAAEAAGCELEFVEASWMELMDRLREGEIDLLAGATKTPGREQFAEFTEPYRSESFVVYTLADKGNLLEAASLDAFLESDMRLGIVAEYYYGEEISKVLDQLQDADRLFEAPIAALNYERLSTGEIDAFIEDPYVASAILRNQPNASRVVPTGIRVEADEVTFMLSKAGVDDANLERFREGLAKIRRNGRLAEILEAWRKTH